MCFLDKECVNTHVSVHAYEYVYECAYTHVCCLHVACVLDESHAFHWTVGSISNKPAGQLLASFLNLVSKIKFKL